LICICSQARRQNFAAGGAHILNTILDVCSNRNVKHELGAHNLNGGRGAGTTDLPGDGPVCSSDAAMCMAFITMFVLPKAETATVFTYFSALSDGRYVLTLLDVVSLRKDCKFFWEKGLEISCIAQLNFKCGLLPNQGSHTFDSVF